MVADRICIVCGEVIPKKPHVTWDEYAIRKYCGFKCSCEGRRIALIDRECVVCGKSFQPSKSHGKARMLRINWCSPACRTELSRQNSPAPVPKNNATQVCQVCGVPFPRKQRESWAQYLARKTCGRICYLQAIKPAVVPDLHIPRAKDYGPLRVACPEPLAGRVLARRLISGGGWLLSALTP